MSKQTFFRVKDKIAWTLVPDEGQVVIDVVKYNSVNAAKRESRKLQKAGVKFERPA